MQSVDVELYNSVQYILDNDPEPLCLTFAVNKTILGEVRRRRSVRIWRRMGRKRRRSRDALHVLLLWTLPTASGGGA